MGILQARILESVAIPSSKRSSQPRDQTQVSHIAGEFLTSEPPGKPTSLANSINFLKNEISEACVTQSSESLVILINYGFLHRSDTR